MNETIQLIDQLIREHKIIHQRSESIEKIANDASLLQDLKEAKDTFVPGRFDQSQSLLELEKMLEDISLWLDEHFNREETVLLAAVEKQGERKILTALNSLLSEHSDLRDRMSHSKKHVAELISGGLGRHRWDASANDMRAHLSHTRKLLETHANMENDLFKDIRRHLKEASRRKEK